MKKSESVTVIDEIAKLFRGHRAKFGITKVELARRSGITRNRIAKVEAGEGKSLTCQEVYALAKALEISSSEIVAILLKGL